MSPVSIAAYILLFACASCGFLFVHLLIGRLLRPNLPNAEKQAIYECGEPTIGSAFVQFDLRFYVVALLFIIFDVEVAFFFPWATVFGKATHLTDPAVPKLVVAEAADGAATLSPMVQSKFAELGVPAAAMPTVDAGKTAAENAQAVADLGRQLAMISFADILVFFAVLLVGFAYVWKRGDLDWVRAVSKERATAPTGGKPGGPRDKKPVLAA